MFRFCKEKPLVYQDPNIAIQNNPTLSLEIQLCGIGTVDRRLLEKQIVRIGMELKSFQIFILTFRRFGPFSSFVRLLLGELGFFVVRALRYWFVMIVPISFIGSIGLTVQRGRLMNFRNIVARRRRLSRCFSGIDGFASQAYWEM